MTTLSNFGRHITKITTSYRFRLIINTYRDWLKRNDRVLDIGCGNGIISKLLINNLRIQITGCDIKNYLIYNIPFVKFNGSKLPFKKNEFDAVILNDVLHHLPYLEQDNLIKESSRVARKVFVFEAEPSITGKIADIILNKFHYGDLYAPLTFRNIEDWQKLFKKLSLNSEVVKLRKPFWYPFSHIAFELQKV